MTPSLDPTEVRDSQSTVAVICGPTGAGKSSAAMRIAEHSAVTIISADSRQIYRGFDVGTAKPIAADRARVPHEGIDVADPGERYSAARWAESATAWIDGARAEGRVPIVVGGTGLYIRALFGGLFDEPTLDANARGNLAEHLATLSPDELRRWTTALDPARAHLGRTQLLRAIEVAILTGTPISRLHRESPKPTRFRPIYIVIDPGPELRAWNERRTDEMLGGGWIEEVEQLIRCVPSDAPAWKSSGYGAVRRLISGHIDAATARQEIVIETRQYAKRQRTWFRHQLPPDVTRVDSSASDWSERVLAWWSVANRADAE